MAEALIAEAFAELGTVFSQTFSRSGHSGAHEMRRKHEKQEGEWREFNTRMEPHLRLAREAAYAEGRKEGRKEGHHEGVADGVSAAMEVVYGSRE